MYRIRAFLTDSRTLSLLGLAALAAFLFLGANALKVGLEWAALACAVLLLVWLGVWGGRRRRARLSADALGSMLEQQAAPGIDNNSRAELERLRARLSEAVRTIKGSKLGQLSGHAALYELPWYITIGNPAAGKSTAVANSGLTFPFEDGAGSVVKGIGGTRNCDWFFTTEGILLDTAGRYSVHEEDRGEWLGFLDLLKKHRPRAPINGIIVTVSIAELLGNPPDFALGLARSLRQRVQELTERLEVFAPVYVMFSKADLINGFNEFFLDVDWNERDRAWGATLPYDTGARQDAITLFDTHFDELYEGLREMSVAQLALARGETMPPGLLAFPLEFAAIKPALRAFVATLFEDNPFQYKPVFRGFYITSALQSGESRSASNERVEKRFGLIGRGPQATRVGSRNGFFLKDLFSKVIFADRNLVRQYARRSKTRMRAVGFLASIAALGLALGAWSWSYVGNRELVDNVRADLEMAVRIQHDRIDLQSRLEALEILQERIIELERLRDDGPLVLGFGLFQGPQLEARLKRDYYAGVSNIMLQPVRANLEAFLTEVGRNPERLAPSAGGAGAAPLRVGMPQRFQEALPANAEDAYNALKTYLMLASRERIEASHLSDQIARFWRGWLEANRGNMTREQTIRSAERLLSFHLQQANDPDWPLIDNNSAIVDQAREPLRRVVKDLPATERVYGEIKARAATRFAPVTVASIVGPENGKLVAGSHVISGAFTAEAWREYVQPAIQDAATNARQNADWVLQTSARDDLTLEGSPEQIQKTLIAMYKQDYAGEWKRFVQGITVTAFSDFPAAVAAMNRLGDANNSPLGLLLQAVFAQTAWDNPAVANASLEHAQEGVAGWFTHSVLRRSPGGLSVDGNVYARPGELPVGPIGAQFSGIARLLAPRDNSDALAADYLKQLAKIRSRLNQLGNQGDPGPGAVGLMRDTLEGRNSELSDALRFVDEQMLAVMPEAQREALRPLLVRPLLETFAAVVKPSARELNKVWLAQVHDPFNGKLAGKYPFSKKSGIEAVPGEIARIFGPEGAIAKYADSAMGALVLRRGPTIVPRTWGDVGLHLEPEFTAGFARWVAPLDGAASIGEAGAASPQTVFMIMPHPAPGTTEYVIEIDGQQLRYRNGAAQWASFIWPNPGAVAGARIWATTFDGRVVEVANFTGRFGLEKLIASADRTRRPDGSFQLGWQAGEVPVSVDLRIVSSAQTHAPSDGSTSQEAGLGGVRLPEIVVGGLDQPAALAVAAREATAPDAAGRR